VPVEAIHALAAAPQGIQADLVPLPDLGHILADLRHFAGPFVAHDHGDRNGHAAFVLVGQNHHVAEADPGGFHLDQHFTRSGFRDGELAHFKGPRLFPGFHDRFHIQALV